MIPLQILFWAAIGFVLYVYVGYPLILYLLGLGRRRRGRATPVSDTLEPTVTFVISAYNEERVLAAKLENTLRLDYPRDRLEVVVVSDGSTDGTDRIASRWAGHGVRLVRCPTRMGKSRALNYTMTTVQSDLVVFSDANSLFEPDAVRKLVRRFADPRVGCATGRLVYNGSRNTSVGQGEGLYWRYENLLGRLESGLGSVLVATGTIFAIRRDLFPRLEGDVANDFQIPMAIAARGLDVVYEPEAVAREQACDRCREEFDRKVRIVLRGLVGFRKMPRHLSPLRLFQFYSHKVARWLVGPALLLMLAANLALARHPLYASLLAGQVIFYALALLGWMCHDRLREVKVVYVPFYFVMVNLAALTALMRFLVGHRFVIWEKAETTRVSIAPAGEPADIHVVHGPARISASLEDAGTRMAETVSRR